MLLEEILVTIVHDRRYTNVKFRLEFKAPDLEKPSNVYISHVIRRIVVQDWQTFTRFATVKFR